MARLKGLAQVQAMFDKKLKDIERATPQAIKDVTLDLLGKAVNLAPVDTGDLRGSGKAEFSDDGKSGTVSFNTPYAIRQHEELDYNHPQGGQARYLAAPFEANQDKYIKHLRDSIKKSVD